MSDKIPTNGSQNPGPEQSHSTRPKGRSKQQKPFHVVRAHSVNIPVYAFEHHGKVRYTIPFYLNGRRHRREFTDFELAKREAKLAAEKIMRGMQAQNDLRPADRESFLAAQRILSEIGVPLVAASEDYVQCRKLLGGTSKTREARNPDFQCDLLELQFKGYAAFPVYTARSGSFTPSRSKTLR